MKKMFSLILGLSVFGLSAVPSAFAGKRRKFTKSEDQQILLHVQAHGSNNWALVANQLGCSARQCMDRYTHWLKVTPGEKTPWGTEQDRLLVEKVQEFGRRWVEISKYFPGYSALNLRDKWRRILRRGNKQSVEAAPIAQNTNGSSVGLTVAAAPISSNTNGSSGALSAIAPPPVVPNTNDPYNGLFDTFFDM